MSRYSLRADVHCCIANGHAAFLDVAADRYFGLPANMEEEFRTFLSTGCLGKTAEQSLAPLIRAGLLEQQDGIATPVCTLAFPPPQISALDSPRSRARVGAIALALISQVSTARDLARRPLKAVLAGHRVRKVRATPMQSPPSSDLITSFLATRRFVGTQDRCLRWSLAMVDFLSKHGSFPQLVLGVKMAPFAAHAWVQHEEVVLNDDVDRVRAYTPILVV